MPFRTDVGETCLTRGGVGAMVLLLIAGCAGTGGADNGVTLAPVPEAVFDWTCVADPTSPTGMRLSASPDADSMERANIRAIGDPAPIEEFASNRGEKEGELRTVQALGRTYVSFALPPRPISLDLLVPIGTAEGAIWFKERGTDPTLLYVLLGPNCLFQPYRLQEPQSSAAGSEAHPEAASIPTFAGLPPAGAILQPITVIGPEDTSPQNVRYIGQPTALFLWAPGCIGGDRLLSALPEVQTQTDKLRVRTVFISIDPSPERVQQALGDHSPPMGVTRLTSGSESLSHPALRARHEAGEEIRVGVILPSYILLDDQGRVRASGAWRGIEHLLEQLEHLVVGR